MKLIIVVVSWNTREILRDCLESVRQHPPKCAYELWVVDNASSDGSGEMVQADFPEAHFIGNEVNVGFAGANNQAIAQISGAEYVLLLNPDTKVKRDALTLLVDFMDAHSEAGAAGSRLLNPDETLQPSCHPMPNLSRELWRLLHLDKVRSYGRYHMHRWSMTEPREVDIIQGAALILRGTVLAKIGLFDETYFMYSEEVDLCRRVQLAGWKLYWVPRSRVIHYGGQSTRQAATAMFLRLYQGKLLFMRKHYGAWSGRIYKLILLFTSLARLSLTPIAWLERGERRDLHLALAGRYWQLIKALPSM